MIRRTVVVLLLLVAACSDGTESVPTSNPTTSSTTTSTSTSTTTTTTAPTTTTTTTVPVPALVDIALATGSFARGFEQPVFLTTRLGDLRIFVVDQSGLVWALDGEEWSIVLDITTPVRFSGEQGLLGLAFHPTHPERMIVHYSGQSGETVIDEYAFPLDAAVVDPEPVRHILRVDQPAANHNGGMIAFGPDGYLYIALGDGGGGGDTFDQAQNPFTLLGAILRIDLDGEAPYAIPPDNPFADGVDGAREVWAWGLRNPWRFSFDGDDIWIGDVGQGDFEEVDLITIADGGVNLGWPILEGTNCFRGTEAECADQRFTPPIHEYRHTGARCSITGGYVYRGSMYPELVGTYLFADYCSGELMGIRIGADGVVDTRVFDVNLPGLTSFGVDAAGEIYVTTTSGDVHPVIVSP